jgi:hypothetical protein
MGVLSGYAIRLTIAQRMLYDRLRSQGIQDDVARQLAVAIEKSVPVAKKRKAGPTYHEKYAEEAKKFLDPLYTRHVHQTAMSRAGGVVSGEKRRAKKEAAIAEALALAEQPVAEQVVKGNKPMGAAFSHARASGKDQSHEARKKRANRYLKEKGHHPIGKALSAATELAKGGPGSGRYPAGSHMDLGYGVTSRGMLIDPSINPRAARFRDYNSKDYKEAAKFIRDKVASPEFAGMKPGLYKQQEKELKKLARYAEEKEKGRLLGTTARGKPVYENLQPDHPSFKKFNASDHFDAAQKYNSLAKEYNSYMPRRQEMRDKAEVHLQLAAQKMNPQGVEKLPQHQQDALHAYTGHTVSGPSHSDLNNALRGLNPYREDQTAHIVHAANLTGAINNSPLEKDATFYRGSQIKSAPAVGDIISTPGFLSVSEKPRVARMFARPAEDEWGHKKPTAIYTIHAPAGTKVLDVNKHLFGIHAHEKEHIFGGDQAFRVKSVRTEVRGKGYAIYKNEVHHVELEAIPSPRKTDTVKKSSGTDMPRFAVAHPDAAKKRLTSDLEFLVSSSGAEPMSKSDRCRAHEIQQSLSASIRLAKFGPLPAEFVSPEFIGSQKKKRRKKKDALTKRASFSLSGRIVKSISKPWQQLVYSVVYAPDTVDLHGDSMDAATIEKAAHEAMRSGIYINHEHGPERLGAHVVESYVAPCDMNIVSAPGKSVTITKGTWVMGMKIEDAATWQRVVDGTYQGFSLEGSGVARSIAA